MSELLMPQIPEKYLLAVLRLCEADLIQTYLLLCLLAKMREKRVYIFQPYDWLVTASPLLLLVQADNN